MRTNAHTEAGSICVAPSLSLDKEPSTLKNPNAAMYVCNCVDLRRRMPLLPAGFTPSRSQPEIVDGWPASENHGVTPRPRNPNREFFARNHFKEQHRLHRNSTSEQEPERCRNCSWLSEDPHADRPRPQAVSRYWTFVDIKMRLFVPAGHRSDHNFAQLSEKHRLKDNTGREDR